MEQDKLLIENFDMTDLGLMSYFLGVEVVQDDDGISLFQAKFASEILDRFGMSESKSVQNPMVHGTKLTMEGSTEKVEATNFKQLVGSPMYLTATGLDITFVVSLISKYMDSATDPHLQAGKRIFRPCDLRNTIHEHWRNKTSGIH